MQEKELVEKFIGHFSTWFNIQTEVYDDTGNHRIDMILTEKKHGAKFGVECKRPGNKRGTDAGKIVMQCHEYSKTTWNKRHIPIFLVPQLSHNEFITPDFRYMIEKDGFKYVREKHDFYHKHHTFNGFLGTFNIGEVRKSVNNTYTFSFSNYPLFRTSYGLLVDYYNKIDAKLNHTP